MEGKVKMATAGQNAIRTECGSGRLCVLQLSSRRNTTQAAIVGSTVVEFMVASHFVGFGQRLAAQARPGRTNICRLPRLATRRRAARGERSQNGAREMVHSPRPNCLP